MSGTTFKCQGQGLLVQAVTSSQAQRWRCVALGSFAAMTVAPRLYQSAGFVSIGTRP